jgi:hypothetical protein
MLSIMSLILHAIKEWVVAHALAGLLVIQCIITSHQVEIQNAGIADPLSLPVDCMQSAADWPAAAV